MNNEINVIDERKVLNFDFRVYGDFDNPLFLAKDVAEWIEHNKPSEMIINVDEDEKLKAIVSHSGQNREMWFLTEDGLYEVLMQSRKPIAKEFKKEVKQILKDLRKGNTSIASNNNGQMDLFTQLMQASMSAISQVLNQNMIDFKDEIKREITNTRDIITEQEIKHEQQLKRTRELIGFKTKNTVGISTLLKTKISDLKGYTIRANYDYHYQLAKQRLFNKYGVYKWEDLQIDKYDEIHADIDSIEDLDNITF